jgi:hypothetical protein
VRREASKLRARVVYDVVAARYVGEVVDGDVLVVAFFRNTWDGAMAAAKEYVRVRV